MRSPYTAPDRYAKRARAEGYAARSVYKLQEIDAKWHLLRPGSRVLELGAAPGSWLQYAAARVGPRGHVEAYDLKPLGISLPANASFVVADVTALSAAPAPADVILSDMAPATMGHHETDALRSIVLAECALALAERCGRPGSSLLVKVLEGAPLPAFVREVAKAYGKVVRARPKATRRQSTELFVLGLHRREQTGATA